jgi:predicted TIM-barrel fold metal-dependent hydrolase
MPLLDGHTHLSGMGSDPQLFVDGMAALGTDGGVVISTRPDTLPGGPAVSNAERLADVLRFCEGLPLAYPFYWVNPTEPDACEQVQAAVDAGAAGIKVICCDHFPGDERAMPTYHAIAATGKPLLFHSGILWAGAATSRYNRPAEFEALIDVPGLRFALAHISWPWCDECIAVYGKFQAMKSRGRGGSVEMFIDTTPGTPPIYRRDALTKVFKTGYNVRNNVLFGTDQLADNFAIERGLERMARDLDIYADLGLDEEQRALILGGNLQRFLGLTD